MEGTCVQSGIRGEDHHLFRVYKAYTSEARLAFFQVLRWGCPKAPFQTFDKYLFASGLSRTSYRKSFDAQQRVKISKNPSGDKFDISLLYKMIQLACHSLASPEDEVWFVSDYTRLEYLLTCIKHSRNSLVHDHTSFTKEIMVKEIENIREILTKVVTISGTLYCVNFGTVDQVLRRINYNLNNIRDQPLAPLDLKDYSNHLLFDSLRATLRLNGAQELKHTYGSKIFLNHLSFLDKNECHLKVGLVFICLSIEDMRSSTCCRPLQSKELLEYIDITTPDSDDSQKVEQEIQNPSLMILEGQPGAGKTTLLRLYMSEWIAGGGDIKGLSDYDLVLHFECRDTSIDSFPQLLLSHMPKTTSKFRKNDLLHIFLSLKAMILVDGLDELNVASRKVLKEILHIKSSCDLTLICTSRAEMIREVHKLVSGRVKVVHMKIQSIPIEKREEFVRVYHCQLKQHGVQLQDIDGLLDYLRQVPPHLQDFLRFPLNLVLLTFLWGGAHPSVRKNISTTALYLETHKLLIEKLLERLMYHPSTQHIPLAKLTTKCDSFLSVMYEEALRALAAGVVCLNETATKRLRQHCISVDLPAEEMFSAFLVSTSYDHNLTFPEEVKFPYKEIQYFYAARHVTFLLEEVPVPDMYLFTSKFDELLRESSLPAFTKRQLVKYTRQVLGQPISIRSVLLEFHEDQSDNQYLERYKNIIFYMVYLLHSYHPHLLEQYAAEVVTLLAATKQMSFEHWVDILKESHYNLTLAQEISKVLSKSIWIVRDQQVQAAAAFLSYNCPSQLTIDIMNDPEHMPHLHDLLEIAATRSSNLCIFFHHHWRCPESGLSNSLLQKLVSARGRNLRPVSLSSTNSQDYLSLDYIRSIAKTVSAGPKIRLVELMGRLSGEVINMLPTSIKELHLAIADDHDALDWFGILPKLSHTLPSLQSIWLHITAGVCPDFLPNLPQLRYRPRLYLSNVGDDNISWASRVSRALLLPNSKYACVRLVRSSLSSRGVNQLAEQLCHLGVGVYCGCGEGLAVASTHLSVADLQSVKDSVRRYLDCPFALLIDDEIWNESIYEKMYEYTWCEKRYPATDKTQEDYLYNTHNDVGSESLYEYITPEEMKAIYTNLHDKHSSVSSQNGDSLDLYDVIRPLGEKQSDSSLVTPAKGSLLPPCSPPLYSKVPMCTSVSSSPICDQPEKTHTEHSSRPPMPLPSSSRPVQLHPKLEPASPKLSTAWRLDQNNHIKLRPRILRPQSDHCSSNDSKQFILPPLNLTNLHPQLKHTIPKPAIPCPLSPRLTTHQPHTSTYPDTIE